MKDSKILILLILIINLIISVNVNGETPVNILGEKVYLEKIIRDSNDKLLGGVLTQNSTLPVNKTQYVFKEGTLLSLYTDGKIKKATLGSPIEIRIGKFILPLDTGTELYFNTDESTELSKSKIILSKETTLLINNLSVPVNKNSRLYFIDNSSLNYSRSDLYLLRYLETEIKGLKYLFKMDSIIEFHENGEIKKGILADNQQVKIECGSIAIEQNSTIYFNEDSLLDLSRSKITIVSNATLKVGNNRLGFKAGDKLVFHNNNELKEGTIISNMDINVGKYQIPLSKNTRLHFDADGTISIDKLKILLYKDTELKIGKNIILFKKDSHLTFWENMHPKSGVLKKSVEVAAGNIRIPIIKDTPIYFNDDNTIDIYETPLVLASVCNIPISSYNLPLKSGIRIYLHDNGTVNFLKTQIIIAKEAEIIHKNTTYILKKDSKLTFYENGQVKDIILARAAVLNLGNNKINLKPESRISFFEDGNVNQIYISAETKIKADNNTITFKELSNIRFHSNNIIKEGVLANDANINFGNYTLPVPAGYNIMFDNNGKLLILSLKLIKAAYFTVGKYNLKLNVGSYLSFNIDRSLNIPKSRFILAENFETTLDNNIYSFAIDKSLTFYSNGNIKSGITGKNLNLKIGEYNIPLRKSTLVLFSKEGNLNITNTRFHLSRETKLLIGKNKIPFAVDKSIYFYPSGVIKQGYINKNIKLLIGKNEITIKGERDIYFNTKGNIDFSKTQMYLIKDTSIQINDLNIKFKKDSLVKFHQNEQFKSGYIDYNLRIKLGNYDITILSNRDLYFKDSGVLDFKITRVYLATNVTFTVGRNTIPFLEGTRIYFYDDYNIKQGEIAKTLDLKLWEYKLIFKAGKRLHFHPDGEIDSERTEIYLFDNIEFKVGNNNPVFRKGTRIYFYPSGHIKKGWMAGPVTLKIGDSSQLTLKTNLVEFFKDGAVKEMILEKIVSLLVGGQNIKFNKGSILRFYNNGSVSFGELAEDSIITTGKNKAYYKQYSKVYFHTNGTLSKGILKLNSSFSTENGNITADKKYPVYFYFNGGIKEGYLYDDTDIKIKGTTIALSSGSFISFYKNGNIEYGLLKNKIDLVIGSKKITFSSDTTVKFYENGNIREGYLLFNTDISGVLFSHRGAVSFYQNGVVSEGLLMKDTELNVGKYKVKFSGETRIHFYKNKNVKNGYLAADKRLSIGNYNPLLSKYKKISFFKDGTIQYGNISESFNLKGDSKKSFLCTAGSWIYIEEENKKIYIINLNGEIESDTPLIIDNIKIIIPEKSKVTYSGDDDIFQWIIPSEEIKYNNKIVASKGIEISLEVLRDRIKENN